jgi:hypothetical protein
MVRAILISKFRINDERFLLQRRRFDSYVVQVNSGLRVQISAPQLLQREV